MTSRSDEGAKPRPTKETFEPTRTLRDGAGFIAEHMVMLLENGTTAYVLQAGPSFLWSGLFLAAVRAFAMAHPEYDAEGEACGPLDDLLCTCTMHEALRDAMAVGGVYVDDEGKAARDDDEVEMPEQAERIERKAQEVTA